MPDFTHLLAAVLLTIPLDGHDHHLTVAHDDWCHILHGVGDCICAPTFYLDGQEITP